MLNIYINLIKRLRIRDNVFHVRLTSKFVVEDLIENADFGLKKWNEKDI